MGEGDVEQGRQARIRDALPGDRPSAVLCVSCYFVSVSTALDLHFFAFNFARLSSVYTQMFCSVGFWNRATVAAIDNRTVDGRTEKIWVSEFSNYSASNLSCLIVVLSMSIPSCRGSPRGLVVAADDRELE